MEAATLIHLQITHYSPVCSAAFTWGRFQSAFFIFFFFSYSLYHSLSLSIYIYCTLFTKQRIETSSMMCLFTQNDFPGHRRASVLS